MYNVYILFIADKLGLRTKINRMASEQYREHHGGQVGYQNYIHKKLLLHLSPRYPGSLRAQFLRSHVDWFSVLIHTEIGRYSEEITGKFSLD